MKKEKIVSLDSLTFYYSNLFIENSLDFHIEDYSEQFKSFSRVVKKVKLEEGILRVVFCDWKVAIVLQRYKKSASVLKSPYKKIDILAFGTSKNLNWFGDILYKTPQEVVNKLPKNTLLDAFISFYYLNDRATPSYTEVRKALYKQSAFGLLVNNSHTGRAKFKSIDIDMLVTSALATKEVEDF